MNREELAWAAGFFDGEGSTFIKMNRAERPYGKRIYIYPQVVLSVGQNDRAVLDRFSAAVNNLGKVVGPFLLRGERRTWQYRVQKYEHIQQVLCYLWPWLSEIKREQAAEAIKIYRAEARGNALKRQQALARTHCKQGHELTPDNVYHYQKIQICKTCAKRNQRAYKERRRAAAKA